MRLENRIQMSLHILPSQLFNSERLFLARAELFARKHHNEDGSERTTRKGKKWWKKIVDLLTCLRESATLIEKYAQNK